MGLAGRVTRARLLQFVPLLNAIRHIRQRAAAALFPWRQRDEADDRTRIRQADYDQLMEVFRVEFGSTWADFTRTRQNHMCPRRQARQGQRPAEARVGRSAGPGRPGGALDARRQHRRAALDEDRRRGRRRRRAGPSLRAPVGVGAMLPGLYDAEKIVAAKYAGAPRRYDVKWKGYSSDVNTWEPAANLPADMVRAFDHKQRRTGDGSDDGSDSDDDSSSDSNHSNDAGDQQFWYRDVTEQLASPVVCSLFLTFP